jgi:phosphate transport system protein
MLDEKILNLKKRLITYSTHVEIMLEKSISGLLERNEEKLKEVLEVLEPAANKYELEFDENCINAIAQYQPVSKNLRILISIIKISNDLERVADHAVNIAGHGLPLIMKPQVKELIDIPKMTKIVREMMKEAIESFVDENVELAEKVCKQDDIVDELNITIKKDLAALMRSDSNVVNRSLRLISISANLERVADLATNICEDVIYLAKGINIKHGSGI